MAIAPLTLIAASAAALVLGAAIPRARARMLLSRAKHRSLAGHARMSRRIARIVPRLSYGPARFFAADGAPEEIAAARRAGFDRLARDFSERFPKSMALTRKAGGLLADLDFTGRYRVPFQFSELVRNRLGAGAFVCASQGSTLTDLDGNRFHDLTGSYGVNLLGYDSYKQLIRQGVEQAEELGPVLGLLHPLALDNAERLRAITGLDQCSFHMSGTEAVMQAVRLARYHTGRSHLVRFCGAYHGWWGDVSPGVGNPVPAEGTYTLADMSERSLKVLATRRNIACVLVNPLQALHPNCSAPTDSMLVDGIRGAAFDREAYAGWLQRLAGICRRRGIVLILDDVFLGFRLRPGSVASLFGIQPDMITFGKTLGGGLPVGVVCGRAELMRRFRDDRPLDVCLARGTFNAHPYVMATMNAFLRRIEEPGVQALYEGLGQRWDSRAADLNARLAAKSLPLRIANMSTVWTVLYDRPSRYNWMLQYYLRAEQLALSWVGSGRLIFSLDFSDEDFDLVACKFVAAAERMQCDGWFWAPAGRTSKQVRRSVLWELMTSRLR